MIIHKARCYWKHRPLYLLRGLCSIIDGLMLLFTLGFFVSSLEFKVVSYQMRLACRLSKEVRLRLERKNAKEK